MSNIFIISNTQFNISKNLTIQKWIDVMDYYFYKEFIPYLQKNVQPNDILVHLGNVFYKSKNLDLSVLTFVQELFENLAKILPIYIIAGENDTQALNILKNFKNIEIIRKPKIVEILVSQKFAMLPWNTTLKDIENLQDEKFVDYCFFNFDYLNSPKKDIISSKLKMYRKCYCGYYSKNSHRDNIKNLGSPYSLEGDLKTGIIVLGTHDDKDSFFLNSVSPKFRTITIDKDEDMNIDKSFLKKDHINVIINKKLFNDSKLKVEMFIEQNDFGTVKYSDDQISSDKEDVSSLDGSSLNLIEIVEDYINKLDIPDKDKMLLEFNKIKELSKKQV